MHFRLTCLILLLFTTWPIHAHELGSPQSENTNTFRCPPCGCKEDNKIYTSPGKCHVCGMHLYKVDNKHQGIAAAVSVFFEGTPNMLYHKFIYPSLLFGIILGILFITGFRGKTFNPFLGGIVLAISLFGFKNQLFGVSYGLTNDFRAIYSPISVVLLIGPLSYFYVSSIKQQIFVWKQKYWLHFAPAFLILLIYSGFFFADLPTQKMFLHGPFETVFGHYEQFFAIILGFLYLGYVMFKFKIFGVQTAKSNFENLWIRKFVIVLLVHLIVWLIIILVNYFIFDLGVATQTYSPLWVSTSLFIYWVIAEVIINPKYFFKYDVKKSNNNILDKLADEKALVLDLMEKEKPYLDQELSLDKLANKIGINSKHLSQVINLGFEKNFYEFINEYRVDEVKRLLLDPRQKHLTIAALASEAGFKSKSSFNSIFKKVTSQTPKEFLKNKE